MLMGAIIKVLFVKKNGFVCIKGMEFYPLKNFFNLYFQKLVLPLIPFIYFKQNSKPNRHFCI